MPRAKVAEAISKYGIDPDKPNPGDACDNAAPNVTHAWQTRSKSKSPTSATTRTSRSSRCWSSPATRSSAEDPLITLESDKATMEVPSPAAGVVKELKVKVGDKVSEGTLVLMLEAGGAAAAADAAPAAAACRSPLRRRGRAPRRSRRPPARAAAPAAARASLAARSTKRASARRTPARRCAASRANSASICRGSRAAGPKSRILKEDVQAYVKTRAGAAARRRRRAAGFNLPPMPQVDFAKFGPVEIAAAVAHQETVGRQPAPQLGHHPARHAARRGRHHRAGSVPQERRPTRPRKSGIKFTLLGFLIKAVVVALKQFPEFQRLAVGRRRKPDAEAVFPHRRGGGHAATGWWCR